MTEEFNMSRRSDPADHRRTPASPDAKVDPAVPLSPRSGSGVAPPGHDIRTPGHSEESLEEKAEGAENFMNENEIKDGAVAPGDNGGWVVSYGNDSREREWLVEICLVLGVAVIVFIVLSSGIFEPAPASAAGVETMGPGGQAVVQAGVAESHEGMRNGAPGDLITIHNTTNPQNRDGFPPHVRPGFFFANAHDVLERGLGNGATTLQQLASVLVLAFSSNRQETTAPAEETPCESTGAVEGKSGRAAISICNELIEFVRPDSRLPGGSAPRFLSLDFKDSPRIRGCVASVAPSGVANTTRYAIGISIDADPPVHVAGFRRESVRYIVALDVSSAGDVHSGRIRVVMPGRGAPLDDGIGNDFYRLGDELAWDGDVSCASWILGQPANGALQYAEDHRGAPRASRRTGATPPRDQILQIATALSGLARK